MKHVARIEPQLGRKHLGARPEREDRLGLGTMLRGKSSELVFEGFHDRAEVSIPRPTNHHGGEVLDALDTNSPAPPR